MFWTFIILLLFFICGFMIGGYLLYKLYPDETASWENGVKDLIYIAFDGIKAIIRFVYREIEGKDLPEYLINPALILTDQEVLDLVDTLRDHPFDTPALVSYTPNINGVSWIDINAIGLTERYKDISNEQTEKICRNIIGNYFMRTRGCQVKFYIRVVTPTRLYFAVPLSEDGKHFLDKQEMSEAKYESGFVSADPMIEIVPERPSDTGEDR